MSLEKSHSEFPPFLPAPPNALKWHLCSLCFFAMNYSQISTTLITVTAQNVNDTVKRRGRRGWELYQGPCLWSKCMQSGATTLICVYHCFFYMIMEQLQYKVCRSRLELFCLRARLCVCVCCLCVLLNAIEDDLYFVPPSIFSSTLAVFGSVSNPSVCERNQRAGPPVLLSSPRGSPAAKVQC